MTPSPDAPRCGLCGCSPCMCGMPGLVTYRGYTREQAKLSVGKGWHQLLEPVFVWLDAHPDADVKVVQVKEKWGTLRIYTDRVRDDLEKLIESAERASMKICETCGLPGTETTDRGWVSTVCEACKRKLRT